MTHPSKTCLRSSVKPTSFGHVMSHIKDNSKRKEKVSSKLSDKDSVTSSPPDKRQKATKAF